MKNRIRLLILLLVALCVGVAGANHFVAIPRAYGPELVTNGTDWTGASGNTPPDGWTKAGTLTQYTIIDGALQVDRNGEAGTNTEQSFLVADNTEYLFCVDILANENINVLFFHEEDLSNIYFGNELGRICVPIKSVSTTMTVGFRPAGSVTQTMVIDNISVKAVR